MRLVLSKAEVGLFRDEITTYFVLVNDLRIQKKKCKNDTVKMLRSVNDNATERVPK